MSDDRPRPLRQAATWSAVVVGGTAIAGIIGVDQISALSEPAQEVIKLLATSGALIGVPHIAARRGEKDVTPVSDPRDNEGKRLIAEEQKLPPI